VGSFAFTTAPAEDPVVIRARGYLSRAGGEQLEQEVVRLLEEGRRRFLINLRETDLINSVGISILIGVIEQVRELGGELAFSELTPVNEEIFRIMGLHRHARLQRADGQEPL
jgi:anti-anti-sigma factor